MLKYILSLSLVLLGSIVEAQKEEGVTSGAEQAAINKGKPGLSVGIDLAPFITHFFADERFGVEATARYAINRKWQVAAELGYENVDYSSEKMDYQSDGSFIRAGIDYNVFKVQELGNNDNILVGVRYAMAVQEHSCPRYTISEEYWGDYEGSFGSSTVNSHWAEFVFGLRSEVLKNFYLGWTVRLRSIINVGADDGLEPYSIPGFGRRDRSMNLGFTYTIEYHLPFKK
ncbi:MULTISPECIES: DUF6048 family protein [unclassified Carboxylicivirga]|uniref:DUF6048 family protein n=1 Tax=Carboxylicivirga TaxID=1628153 RepID=UPI003D33C38E